MSAGAGVEEIEWSALGIVRDGLARIRRGSGAMRAIEAIVMVGEVR